ncbi:unnamed protein product [Hermetia illucens]|uniref:Uncharacterized protein n=1 Tax=Hermetia illucens TaxID=343691 RepID=A0A7R8YZ09_HERIL|nr:unnamed protein product [Hermetia illucens]
MTNKGDPGAGVPLTRVNVKFLDLEIEALRKKIQLYKKTSIEDKEQIRYLSAPPPDADYEHLQTIANQKFQIYLKIGNTLKENQRLIEEINEDFRTFKAATHLKSCIECGEIIFEMRKLRAKFNMYIDFKKNQERFKKNCDLLVRNVGSKVFDFLKNVRDTSSHVQEQRDLIARELKKKLSNEAFRIGWQTLSGNTQRYLRAKMNNIDLQNYTFMTLQQRRPEPRVKSKTSKESKASKIGFQEILVKLREISNLRKRIDNVTKEIAQARKQNRERKSSEPITGPLIFLSTEAEAKYSAELQPVRHEFQPRRSRPQYAINRYNLIQTQIAQMNLAKEEIMNRAKMVTNFRRNPANLLKKCIEAKFQSEELHSFLATVYDLSRKPPPVESTVELQQSITRLDFRFGSESTLVNVDFSSKSKLQMEEDSDEILSNLTVATDQTSYSGSSVLSRRASVLFDVESDPEELNYLYELKEEDEMEELEETPLHTEISIGASMDV